MRWFVYLLIGLLGASPALCQDRTAVERQFQVWINETVWPDAKSKGVSKHTFQQAFDGVTLNWDLPDLVPPGANAAQPAKQKQAEFGAPARYFSAGSVQGATSVGRKMGRRHAQTLAQVQAETGVPARILLAIWGRESGYGQVPIRHDAIQVLATKGFMSTRAELFYNELLAALQIVEAGLAPPGRMKSSWAGALGQPQFMPSSFLEHGIDGNGDGATDIWSSADDTLASIGHYLVQHGWVRGRDWGFEVKVPPSISCAREGPDQGKPIREWVKLGIERVSGKPFPQHELPGEGYLMMPAGRKGPAFLVTPNFYVLKKYNNSDLYALFVGHVGDRIQFGVGDFKGRWEDIDGLYRSDIAAMQRALEAQGHDVGGADGLPGFKTRRSIGRWQQETGRAPTCFPTFEMKTTLAR
ncbi:MULTISPECIES: lytic murein transglycosylase [unclassified Ruegeria]|uniref:lytic murein transglycosylase n=1 Tax=unclassified Ruegeria TaxID=2625375 RepID=UPI001ADBF73C|nr:MULTISPECIES: lytic murein transglycosylase [unclassified Ruegeria]MBO9412578.1 lytic murein transglycosylase [Ruegeria sp. R8_1]MBO9416184.1 lytic murein transglycosylase [Ruegeria sp. R8_2]